MEKNVRPIVFKSLHNISADLLEEFLKLINPQKGEVILDAMGGYGDVADLIKDRVASEVYLLDSSSVQIERAKKSSPEDADKMICGSVMDLDFNDEYFDKVVVKMGLHELKFEDQLTALREIFRVLKPGGELVMWNIILDEMYASEMRSIIRKKDFLAGFKYGVENRHFITENELKSLVSDAGFTWNESTHVFTHRFSTKNRLKELSDDKKLLLDLNNFIKSTLDSKLKTRWNYTEKGDDVVIDIQK